jgi:hypothetical protein
MNSRQDGLKIATTRLARADAVIEWPAKLCLTAKRLDEWVRRRQVSNRQGVAVSSEF